VLRRFRVAELPRERWRNGAGWTRTVCAREADRQLRWRVSVADITAAAPFSAFAGMDRTAVMVRGAPLRLSHAGHLLVLEGPGSMLQFPGEWTLQCEAPERPTRLLNVMVQRGKAAARVRVVRDDAAFPPAGGEQVGLVLRGGFEFRSSRGEALTLAADEGVHCAARHGACHARPLADGAILAWCALG